MLTADLAVIFLKYIHSPPSTKMSSNGFLMLLLKVFGYVNVYLGCRDTVIPTSLFLSYRQS